jgi:hypothetical protein
MGEKQHLASRIMYIEHKPDGVNGEARIGRVSFSKSGRTLHYRDREYVPIASDGKANYCDAESYEQYWISGCKRRGGDRLYPGDIKIDDDIREEYWTQIRNMPEKKDQATIRCAGKYGGKQGRK